EVTIHVIHKMSYLVRFLHSQFLVLCAIRFKARPSLRVGDTNVRTEYDLEVEREGVTNQVDPHSAHEIVNSCDGSIIGTKLVRNPSQPRHQLRLVFNAVM